MPDSTQDAAVETWRAVPGFPNYEVSDQGRVRSLDRRAVGRDGRNRKLAGKILSPGVRSDNHKHVVVLCERGNCHTKYVHRLVLEAFVGPAPDGREGCHRDDDSYNNRLTNLYWGTRSDNLYDAVRNGRHSSAAKTHCKHGHLFTEENTFQHTRGGRQCRACHTRRSRERRARLRAEERP